MQAMAPFLSPLPPRVQTSHVVPATLAADREAAGPRAPAPPFPTASPGRSLEQRARRPVVDATLRRRNALVEAHLPLARAVVARFAPRPPLPHEDLVQVASMGLIRAVEAFDPSRAVSFSSFAVPYIRGALLHELRDRQPMVRIPRPLWELRQQASRLQEERRAQGRPPLDSITLAARLGCAPERLLEIEGLSGAAMPRSLDAPIERGHPRSEGGEAGSLLDQLADPRSLTEGSPDTEPDPALLADERQWFRRQLAQLDPMRRQLLEGRLRLGCTWVELGRELGIHPRMAQRRCDAAVHELRLAAERWRAERQG